MGFQEKPNSLCIVRKASHTYARKVYGNTNYTGLVGEVHTDISRDFGVGMGCRHRF